MEMSPSIEGEKYLGHSLDKNRGHWFIRRVFFPLSVGSVARQDGGKREMNLLPVNLGTSSSMEPHASERGTVA